jgi:hypothetical protein
VEFVLPVGYAFTDQETTTPDDDSDADEYGLTDREWLDEGEDDDNVDCGLAAAFPPEGPTLEIISASGNRAGTLRVAKWEHAFKTDGSDTVRNDFPCLDPDKFQVRVVDTARNTDPAAINSFTVHVSTTHDPGNEVTVWETEVNSGVFLSRCHLLTSFRIDDVEVEVDGIPDDNLDEPTFFVELDDLVTATYGALETTAHVPIVKVVKLHINVLRSDGEPVITRGAVEEEVELASKVFAQVGIRFQATIEDPVNPPAGVQVDPFRQGPILTNDAGQQVLSPDESGLLGAFRTAATDDIEVYYVKQMGVPGFPLLGRAYIASVVPDARYADSIVVAANKFLILAHEIGHVLLDAGGHFAANGAPYGVAYRVNLMVDGEVMRRDVDYRDSRRLTAAQATDILRRRPGLLIAPS